MQLSVQTQIESREMMFFCQVELLKMGPWMHQYPRTLEAVTFDPVTLSSCTCSLLAPFRHEAAWDVRPDVGGHVDTAYFCEGKCLPNSGSQMTGEEVL